MDEYYEEIIRRLALIDERVRRVENYIIALIIGVLLLAALAVMVGLG